MLLIAGRVVAVATLLSLLLPLPAIAGEGDARPVARPPSAEGMAGAAPVPPSDSPRRSELDLNPKPEFTGGGAVNRDALFLARTLTHVQARQGWSTAFKIIAVLGGISTAVGLIETATSPPGYLQLTVGVVTAVEAAIAAISTGVALAIDSGSRDLVEEEAQKVGFEGATRPERRRPDGQQGGSVVP